MAAIKSGESRSERKGVKIEKTGRIELPQFSSLKAKVNVAYQHAGALGAQAEALTRPQLHFFRKMLGADAAEEERDQLEKRFVEETHAAWREFAEAAWRGDFGRGVLYPAKDLGGHTRVIPTSERGERHLLSFKEGSSYWPKGMGVILPRDGGEKHFIASYNNKMPYAFVAVNPKGSTQEEYAEFWERVKKVFTYLPEQLACMPEEFRVPSESIEMYPLGDFYYGLMLPSGGMAVGHYWDDDERSEGESGTISFNGVAEDHHPTDERSMDTLRPPTPDELAFLESEEVRESEWGELFCSYLRDAACEEEEDSSL